MMNNIKNILIKEKFLFKTIVIYLLFSISIFISIIYTEISVFNHIVINSYVLGKVFITALENTFFAIMISRLVTYFFGKTYKINGKVTKSHEKLILENDFWANLIIILLFSLTFLPLKTVITLSYVGNNEQIFRLAFVHFSTLVKIISSVILICSFSFFIHNKYKLPTRKIVTIIFLLSLPPFYNIYATRNNDFDALEIKIMQIENQNLNTKAEIVNPEIGKKVIPLTEKLLKIAKTDSELATAYRRMGEAELLLGNFDKALEYNDKSLKIDEYSASTHMGRSMIFRSIGKYQEALDESNRCLLIATEKHDIKNEARCESEISYNYVNLATIVYKYKNFDYFKKAKEHMENSMRLDPENIFYKDGLAYVIVTMSEYYYFNNNAKDAVGILDSLINDLESGNYLHSSQSNMLSDVYANRGDIKRKLKDYDGALADLEKSLDIYPEDNKYALIDIGSVYWEKNEYKKAMEFYEKAIASDPENKSSVNNQKVLGHELDLSVVFGYQETANVYTKLLFYEPNNIEYYRGRAFAYEQLKQYGNALFDYKKAFELATSEDIKQNILGSIIMDQYYLREYSDMCDTLRRMNITYSFILKTDNGEEKDLTKMCENL